MGGGRRILVVDVGGKNIKCRCSTTPERRKTPSGPGLTPEAMVAAVRELSADWDYDAVSLGLPGPVRDDRVTLEPGQPRPGWVGFDLAAPSACPPASSTTPRCRRWAPTPAAACCSWA
jgi:polyphosphate glucokinase